MFVIKIFDIPCFLIILCTAPTDKGFFKNIPNVFLRSWIRWMGQLDFKGIYIQQPGSLCVFCLRFCVNELLFLQKTNCLRHFKWNKIWHKNFGIEKKYMIKELYIMHLKFVLLWSEVWVKYCRSNYLVTTKYPRFLILSPFYYKTGTIRCLGLHFAIVRYV